MAGSLLRLFHLSSREVWWCLLSVLSEIPPEFSAADRGRKALRTEFLLFKVS